MNPTGSEDSFLSLTCTLVSFGHETGQPARGDGRLTFEASANPANGFGSSHLPAAVTFLNKTCEQKHPWEQRGSVLNSPTSLGVPALQVLKS